MRKALHHKGFRFRIHTAELPGKPDIVFPSRKSVIQVHGCFWHGHDCHLFKWPSSRTDFWKLKLERNKEKDKEVKKYFLDNGWRMLIIWECAIKGRTKLNFESVITTCSTWLNSKKPEFLEISGKSEK